MPEAQVREHAINLFKFLRELTLLRTKVVRTLDKYEQVIWFDSVPNCDECFSVYAEKSEDRSELWLEVEQPSIPKLIPPTLELEPWIRWEHLMDASLEMPPLQKTIFVQRLLDDVQAHELKQVEVETSEKDAETAQLKLVVTPDTPPKSRFGKAKSKQTSKRTEQLQIDKHPEIQAAYENYVAEVWKPWSEAVRPFMPQQKLYAKLFDIHNTLEKEAENFELLLAVGCLAWTTPTDQKVFRHVLTARANLEFDAVRGVIAIKAPIENNGFIMEQDMLEMSERPQGQQRNILEEAVDSLNSDFWNSKKTTDLLELFAHSISARGEFINDMVPPSKCVAEPTVALAPAIIFRSRNDQAFVRLFDGIVSQLEDGQSIPLGIERLVNIVDDENESSHSEKNGDLVDEEIYFPLPANPDQREIAQRLQTRQGILVQGPPGTGKSHTIANLVCHLLASGKRVLVTSHTPRALTVLRDKFPEELQALCVSVVGDDSSESRKALEDSVGGITAKHNNWNERKTEEKVEELYKDLDEARKAEQWTLNALRSIKEKDTFHHDKKFKSYSGTAQNIAQQIKKQEQLYNWFPESVDANIDVPLGDYSFAKFISLMRAYDSEQEKKIAKSTLSIDALPTPIQITELTTKIRSAKTWSEKIADFKSHEAFAASTKLTKEDRDNLVHLFDQLISLFNRIKKRPENFTDVAAKEIVGDHDRKWRELLAITKKYLEFVPEDYRELSQLHLSGADKQDVHSLKIAAKQLQSHLKAGGKLGFGPFRPKVVKETLFLIEGVKIEGAKCDNLESLDRLIRFLELEIGLSKLRKNWEGVAKDIPEAALAAIPTFQDFCEPLEDCLQLYDKMNELREKLSSFPALGAPQWENIEAVKTFRDVTASGAAEEELMSCMSTLQEYETRLRSAANDPHAHPVVSSLLDAISNLDDEQYHASFDLNEKLLKDKDALKTREDLRYELYAGAPAILQLVEQTYQSEIWDTRSQNFENAWHWAQASKWLKDLSDPSVFKRYKGELTELQTKIREILRELAAHKAWQHTFSRLSEEQRQHLISWSMAVKRIGKGSGKHAEKHRRDARMHMEKCRSAIPAWIMPIHKVVESVLPGQDAFDVIIVDEASQSGPEALFLLYLAKQIVVVGDDKQISPDNVGLDRGSVDALRNQFLKGVPHSDAIGLEHSFFDQAKIRYKGKLRLKEHFRCMPEIIQFSNNLCYASEPLIPLRQYGGGRITPVVKAVHVEDGYIDEDATKPVNKPEAYAVCMEVKRICEDPLYDKKTIGIISLLNTSGQAKYIEDQLRNSGKFISKAEYDARQIRVGDSYMFQGDERDIILLTMVSAPSVNKRLMAITADKDERRYNVAVSRARDQLILFHSVTTGDLNPKCLRSKLISYCNNPHVEMEELDGNNIPELRRLLAEGYAQDTSPPKPFDSLFELDVFLKIVDRGYRVIPHVEMNGYYIDLIIEGLKGRLAVECDGDRWHGPEKYDADMARQRDLERCGMKFWRIRGSAFYHNPDTALDELWDLLERLEIQPKIQDVDQRDLDREDYNGLNFSEQLAHSPKVQDYPALP